MDKITTIKIKYADGSFSSPIPIGVFAQAVEWKDNQSLRDVIGSGFDLDTKGSIQSQLDRKLENQDIATQVATWFSQNVNVAEGILVDDSLSISNQAADSKVTGTYIDKIAKAFYKLAYNKNPSSVGRSFIDQKGGSNQITAVENIFQFQITDQTGTKIPVKGIEEAVNRAYQLSKNESFYEIPVDVIRHYSTGTFQSISCSDSNITFNSIKTAIEASKKIYITETIKRSDNKSIVGKRHLSLLKDEYKASSSINNNKYPVQNVIKFGTSYTEPILQENNDVFWVVRSEIITITEEDSNIVFNYIESQTNPIDFNNISGTISTALEQRLGTMQEDISSAQEDITSIQGSNSDSLSTVNLNTLDRRVTSVSSTVNNLMSNAPANTTIKSLSDKISSLESTSTTLRNDVNSASSTANSNATQITNLTSRVTAEQTLSGKILGGTASSTVDRSNNPINLTTLNDRLSTVENSTSTATLVVNQLPSQGQENIDYIVLVEGEYQYYKYINNEWRLIAGGSAEIIEIPQSLSPYILRNSLPVNEQDYVGTYIYTPTMSYYTKTNGTYRPTSLNISRNASKDYYLKDENNVWRHYRYINNNFEEIGSDSYTRQEVDAMIATNTNAIDMNTQSISNLSQELHSFDTVISDISADNQNGGITVFYKDSTTKHVSTADTKNVVEEVSKSDDGILVSYTNGESFNIEISGSGGGAGGNTGSVLLDRVTASGINTVLGSTCPIRFKITAKDASNEILAGTTAVSWYVDNVKKVTSQARYGDNVIQTFDIGPYLKAGENTIKASITISTGDQAPITKSKIWNINVINLYLEWKYDDSTVNKGTDFTVFYTPFGNIEKTLHIKIDNVEQPTISLNARSGSLLSFTKTALSHGSHKVELWLTATVNGETIISETVVHDMIFASQNNTTPIIAASLNKNTVMQYDTLSIPIVIYDPQSLTADAILKVNNQTVATWPNIDRTVHYWNFVSNTSGIKTLAIVCGSVTKTLTVTVEALTIDVTEASGYDFKFKASDLATNEAVKNWSNSYTSREGNSKNVNITFSNNFDWINGGLHSEIDENGSLRQYFAVRAGTTMTFNYNLFGTDYDPKVYGKSFKFIFKAVNCRNYDANVLSCVDATSNANRKIGLLMTANEATLTTSNNTLKTYYYKDSYIEFETNIHAARTEYPYLQFWMDGSPDSTILYTDDTMQQTTPVGITIGSPHCDVYVYLIKAYPTFLSNENEISNFIMDAPNAQEMVNRYNRNDILNSQTGEIDYNKLADKNPDLHILLLDLNKMTSGKKDNAVAHTFEHIYRNGGPSQNFTVENACVTVQGTSSVGYLESAGNVDINFKYNREFASENVNYTTGAVIYEDGSTSQKGFALTENSIPVDYLNVKVNVASSENANNACIADWYNTYQPWRSYARRKNPKARDTMEFVPGVIFIKDRSGGLFDDEGENASYHFYGICDLGNSKKNKKVFHDTENPLAVCVEVGNNTSLPCLMTDNNYEWNDDNEVVLRDGENNSEQTVFEFRYLNEDYATPAKSAWDRFVTFFTEHHPNLATGDRLTRVEHFDNYTFKGSKIYNLENYNSETYDVVYLYGYGVPSSYNNGIYSASEYRTDTTENATCYYYINYSNDQIYSSNGSSWTSLGSLTYTMQSPVLASQNNKVTISTYAGDYTNDTYEYRMAYLLAHCEEYLVMDPVVYHFIFIESFLMTDNVAKNTFWSSDDLVHWELSKDYDNDTALGNDNVGGLSFTYGLETDSTLNNNYVFNASTAAWITFVRNLFGACQAMYRHCESQGCFNSNNFLTKLKNYQSTRPERIWIADAQRKYLRPYEDNNTRTYLSMLAGRKTHQREQVKVYNSYYYASKYVSDICTQQNVMVRCNTPTEWGGLAPEATAMVTMYIDSYIVVASTSYNVVSKIKAKKGQSYLMNFTSAVQQAGETEIYFCLAPMITELSGLAHLYIRQNNFSFATNLQRLEIGSTVAGYENRLLPQVTIGDNPMLEYVDIRNCPNASGSLDFSNCLSLSELYLENTSFTGVILPTGGLTRVVHLPNPTSLTMKGLIYLEDLLLESATNLIKLRVEDCIFNNSTALTIGNTTTLHGDVDLVLQLVIAAINLSRVRLLDIDWLIPNGTLLDRLVDMSGITEAGDDYNQSVVTGQVTVVGEIYERQIAKYEAAWSNQLNIIYNQSQVVSQWKVEFRNSDENDTLLYTTYVSHGETPEDPVESGYIEAPTKAPSVQYTFEYNGWQFPQTGILRDSVIYPDYIETTRTYVVNWYLNEGDLQPYHSTLTSTTYQGEVPYGSEVVYDGPWPKDESGESRSIYKIFTGWDKSTGYIDDSLITNPSSNIIKINARWEQTNWNLIPGSKDLNEMSRVEIYAMHKQRLALQPDGVTGNYINIKDHFNLNIGLDFNFDNIESEVLVSNKYFNRNNTQTTNVSLLNETDGVGDFTLAIEYEFTPGVDTGQQLSVNQTLVSCLLSSGSDGFRISYNGSNPYLYWGSQSTRIGTAGQRDIVVLRYKKQNPNQLIVYCPGSNSSSLGYGPTTNARKIILTSSTPLFTTEKLHFGSRKYGSWNQDAALGWIYWAKIWYGDLGERVTQRLGSWIHETVRMEYAGKNLFSMKEGGDSLTADLSDGTYIAANLLSKRSYMRNSGNNQGGWAENPTDSLRTLLNEKLFNALDYGWRSIIPSVEVYSTKGINDSTTQASYDKIFVWGQRELGGISDTQTSSIYYNENAHRIPWFVNDVSLSTENKRVRFPMYPFGDMNLEDITIYVQQDDPTSTGHTLKEGDIWLTSLSSGYGRYYLSNDTMHKHTYIGDTVITDLMRTGDLTGRWLPSITYWLRSASNSTSYPTFYHVTPYGSISYSYTSTSNTYNGILIGLNLI